MIRRPIRSRTAQSILCSCVALSCLLAACHLAGAMSISLSTDDTEMVQPGTIEVQAGGAYSRIDSRNEAYDAMLILLTGFYSERLELGIAIPYLWTRPDGYPDENGFSDVTAGLKLKPIDQAGWWPALALELQLKTTTGDADKGLGTGASDYTALLVADSSFGEILLIANLGYTYVDKRSGFDPSNVLVASAAVELPLSETLLLSAELYSELPTERGYKNYVDTGVCLSYTWAESTWLQFGGSAGLSDEAEDYIVFWGVIRDY